MRGSVTLRAFLLAAILATQIGNRAHSGSVFHIKNLPMGKDVTFPVPAATLVPIDMRATFGATDLPQTISMKVHSTGSKGPIRVSIYDANAERVKYADVSPGTPYLYTFKTLGQITLIPKTPGGTRPKGLGLRVESDKPLKIAR